MDKERRMSKRYFNARAHVACVAAVVVLATVSGAQADIVLGISDWDTNLDPWTNQYGWTTIGRASPGGNTGGWLRVTFTNTTAEVPDSSWSDIARTSATNLYTGTWTTQMWITFDFWQSNVVAGAIQVQWKSLTNSDIWGYALTPPAITGGTNWTTLTAPLLNWWDWAYPFATEQQYLADLSSVDWIGIYILRDTTDQQIYGIDNVKLMVPEPAECALLAVAAITSTMSLRRKRRKKIRDAS
jgi:hypothetical protein